MQTANVKTDNMKIQVGDRVRVVDELSDLPTLPKTKGGS